MSTEPLETQPQLASEALEVSEDEDAFFAEAYERGWTDGLPVIPPTRMRIARMLGATSLPADAVVGVLDPRRAKATVEKVAINAVMAGCLPQYMPVLIAAVRALARPEFNLHGIQGTTNPVAPLAIVNGPVRNAIGMNAGPNVLGQGNRANATIGRALRLLLLNVGGGLPGSLDKAVHGMPAKYSFCLAEDEENSPWEPLHAERGYEESQSTVTLVGVSSMVNNLLNVHPDLADPRPNLRLLANSMAQLGSNNMLFGRGNPVFALPSRFAQLLSNAGYDKGKVQSFLWEQASVRDEDFPMEMRFPMGTPLLRGGRLYPCRRPEDILILVAGGPQPYHVMYMPNFGETDAVTEEVDEA